MSSEKHGWRKLYKHTLFIKHPTYHKQLSNQQKQVLRVVAKFRFVSVPVLAGWLGKDKSTIYEQLLGLTQQDYLFKQYDSSYRLQLRPATYALTPKGIRQVRELVGLDSTALRNMYQNRTASDTLVVQSLAIAKLCLQLKQQYSGVFDLMAKSELAQSEYFLRPLSDLYLRRREMQDTQRTQATKAGTSVQPEQPMSYLLERIEAGTYTWILKKRLRLHQDWLDEHEEVWEDNYPTLLFACGNVSTEKRIHRLVNNAYFDFEVMTTTEERLKTNESNIWACDWEPEWDKEVILRSL